MEPLPHRYSVTGRSDPTSHVVLEAAGLGAFESAPPAEFGGPGDRWSPETLFVAAAVDCFVLTFRAIARASKLDWRGIECRGEGTLDRTDGVTRFVGLTIHADLTLPDAAQVETAERLLAKAEKNCLVSNSLALEVELEANVTAVE